MAIRWAKLALRRKLLTLRDNCLSIAPNASMVGSWSPHHRSEGVRSVEPAGPAKLVAFLEKHPHFAEDFSPPKKLPNEEEVLRWRIGRPYLLVSCDLP